MVGNDMVAKLDVDARYGNGPETITIYGGINRTCIYFVSFFEGIGYLGSSEAKVEIITKNNEREIFTVPIDCRESAWTVMGLKIDGPSVIFLEISKCFSPESPRLVDKDSLYKR
jgi:hypothetical protein